MGSRAIGIWLAVKARASVLGWLYNGSEYMEPPKQAEYEYIAALEERIEALETQIRECNPGLPPVDRNFRHG